MKALLREKDTVVQDVSFLKDVLEWAWGLVLGLLGIIWTFMTGRIKKLEDRVDELKEHTLTKTMFEQHVTENKEVQRDLREGIREVTALITQMEQRSTSRHTDLLTLLVTHKNKD